MHTTNEFKTKFNSEICKIKSILNDISLFLNNNIPYMSVEDRTDFKLIFTELLCNAVMHGNKNDKNKLVEVSIEINDNFVIATIEDQGQGFDYLNFLDSFDNTSPFDYKESGRGITLAYSLTDAFSFNQRGNIIKFQKKVN